MGKYMVEMTIPFYSDILECHPVADCWCGAFAVVDCWRGAFAVVDCWRRAFAVVDCWRGAFAVVELESCKLSSALDGSYFKHNWQNLKHNKLRPSKDTTI